MNCVLLDSDCIKFYPNREALELLLGGTSCTVVSVEDLVEKGCRPDGEAGLGSHCERCVLLTAFSGGIKQYHRQLFQTYNNFSKWTITILNVEFEGEKRQLLNEIDSLLSGTKILYNVLFDNASELEKTREECAKSIRAQKLCMVVSQNLPLAQQVGEYLSRLLESWDVAWKNDGIEKLCGEANAILVVGEQPEDFQLTAPQFGLGRYFIWLRLREPGMDEERTGEKVMAVKERLLDNGWTVGTEIFFSCLEYEAFDISLKTGALTETALRNQEGFVLWDQYALPVPEAEYTDENIRAFLDKICCFRKIINKF